MIDEYGYRANVGIIVANQTGKVLLARCKNNKNWQFPQGGIEESEKPLDAAFRELYEEVGLTKENVELITCTRSWMRYIVPERYRRKTNIPVCIGQKQKWFLMRLLSDDSKINLTQDSDPEFDRWDWYDYWQPIEKIVYFKRDVYRSVLCELAINVLDCDNRYLPKKYRVQKNICQS